MSVTKTKGHGPAAARAASRARRHTRVRKKVTGSAARPRLTVNRSARHIFAQLVDDGAGRTLVSASTLEADLRGTEGDKKARAHQVGQLLASRARAAAGPCPLVLVTDMSYFPAFPTLRRICSPAYRTPLPL